MKYLMFFIITLIVIIISSCKQEKKLCTELTLNADVMDVIGSYISEHQRFNTFLLQSTQSIKHKESIIVRQGFLLGPGYKSLIEKHNPIFYFDVLEKRVFFISPVGELIQRNKNEWIIKNEPDSIEISNGRIIKNSSELFIYRSIYFYYNESENLEVNLRPDTIFAPKIAKISIQFENIE